ncbi:MAG: hypothetical protein QM743_13775 [Chitinophagaceae bacterium]
MKKAILSLIAVAAMVSAARAQAPQAINYQAAVRNASGAPLSSSLIQVRFTIHDLTATGTTVFQETNTVTTTAQGIMNTAIGTGTAVTGTLAGVDWSSGAKFLEVEINAGSGYTSIGSQQMVSVPYALYAGNGYWMKNGVNIYNGNMPDNVGINVTNPQADLHVKGSSEIMRIESNLKGWQSFYNKTNYLGYIGMWTDTADLDFGTSGLGRNVNLVTNATPKLTIVNTGEVGIGTTTPLNSTKLQVSGTGSSTGVAPFYSTAILATTNAGSGGTSTGVYGESTWRGVFGRNKGSVTRSTALGVYGLVDSATNYSQAYGVMGEVSATGTTGCTNYGIYGWAKNGTSNYSVYGVSPGSGSSDYAGYFNGKIYAVSASSSIKAFAIDHPLDPQINTCCIHPWKATT